MVDVGGKPVTERRARARATVRMSAETAGAVARGERPYRVVFAAQPSVPAGRAERRYLLRRAVAHARRYPDREVVVKLRSRPGEHTTHLEEVPYQKLATERDLAAPANLRLAYGHMGRVLDGTDLLVEVATRSVRWLRPGGWLLLELGGDQADLLGRLLVDLGFDAPDLMIDGDGDPRAICARLAH